MVAGPPIQSFVNPNRPELGYGKAEPRAEARSKETLFVKKFAFFAYFSLTSLGKNGLLPRQLIKILTQNQRTKSLQLNLTREPINRHLQLPTVGSCQYSCITSGALSILPRCPRLRRGCKLSFLVEHRAHRSPSSRTAHAASKKPRNRSCKKPL